MTEASPDPYEILKSLGISDASQAEIVTGGSDTVIWKVTWQGQQYALRVFRPEQKNAFDGEVAAVRKAAAGGIPVPEVIRQGLWNDHPVMLLSWIPGATLAQTLMARPYLGWKLGKIFGQMQAKIHQIAVPETPSTDWIEWAGDEPELKARLYELKSRRSTLLHLDYHPLNVMTDGQQITGVLDWVNARTGDPRADFARTYTILRVEPYPPEMNTPVIALFRRVLERAWRSGYLQAGGSLGNPDEMTLFCAWAGAVMIRDLGRHISNPDHWLQDHHFDGVRYWCNVCKSRAGIW